MGRGQRGGTLAATCCWIFPSSVTTQCVVAKAPRATTLSKAERLRSQPGPERGSSSNRPRTPIAAAILPPRPGRSHRKRKRLLAVRHLGEVASGTGGGARGVPRRRYRSLYSRSGKPVLPHLRAGNGFLVIVFLEAIRSPSVGIGGEIIKLGGA
ncbi:mCG59368 [Mus musculus]|nr:mCG59368 [Mus musculus]